DYYLIDVREEAEWKGGFIPTAKNVPLSQFATAWQSPQTAFQATYGFEKPPLSATVVLYCKAGVRSARAAEHLRQLGYENIRNYSGSWDDYAERTQRT
ncbi:Rhodanese-like domain-containing protein, partial [Spinellus fusiger]